MNNTKFIARILCFVLALVTVMGCIGCKKSNEGDDSTDQVATVENQEAVDLLAEIPVEDFEGREITLLTPVGYGKDWEIEGYTGNAIDDSRFTRNEMFKEAYNCTLYVHHDDNLVDLLINNAMAGSGEFDMVFPHPTAGMTQLLASDVLADLHSIEELRLDKPWYNQSQVTNYTTNNKLYIVTTDASITGQAFFGLVYNRDLYESHNFKENLSDVVKNGDWTIEKMRQICVQVSDQVEGSDSRTYALSINSDATARWLYALGGQILRKNSNNQFEVGMTQRTLSDLADGFYNLMFVGGNTLSEGATNAELPTSEQWDALRTGKSLFTMWDIGSQFGYLHELEFSEGYIPMPKLDENQDDYRVICGAGFYAIPNNCQSKRQSALLLEYFSVYAYTEFKPVFFEKILNGRVADYAEDAEMLDFMHSKKFFDLGFTLDNTKIVKNMLADVVLKNQSAFGASVWLTTNKNSIQAMADTANQMGIEK